MGRIEWNEYTMVAVRTSWDGGGRTGKEQGGRTACLLETKLAGITADGCLIQRDSTIVFERHEGDDDRVCGLALKHDPLRLTE